MFNEENEKFQIESEDSLKERNLKLLVDFEIENHEVPKNQIEIGDIKYKKRKKVSVKEIDLKENKRKKNSIF